MKGFLTKNMIKYVLYHFQLTADISNIADDFIFTRNNDQIEQYKNKIIFLLSDKTLDADNYLIHQGIPVFFKVHEKDTLCSVMNTNLVFNFDILKSAFFLLSGFQEYESDKKDFYGRFPFSESIQKRLGFIHKPIVNYYFKFISETVNEFAGKEIIKNKRLFKNYGLLLTHDIDNIRYYTFNEFLYKIKELFGLVSTNLKKKDIIKYLIKFLALSKENPYWNFPELIGTEKQYDLKSCFYFLHKEQKNVDSIYKFSDRLATDAFEYIKTQGFEIGLHGTANSARNAGKLLFQKNELEQHAAIKVYGGRQHRLIFDIPFTMIIQENVGLKYDSSLGFAEHEGFKNSFCYPFKLFDFENDRMIDVWEFPLTAMDVTLFFYRKYKKEAALKSIENLIREISRFGGLFTLLWHNGFETAFGDNSLNGSYSRILKTMVKYSPKNMMGKELINKLNILILFFSLMLNYF